MIVLTKLKLVYVCMCDVLSHNPINFNTTSYPNTPRKCIHMALYQQDCKRGFVSIHRLIHYADYNTKRHTHIGSYAQMRNVTAENGQGSEMTAL